MLWVVGIALLAALGYYLVRANEQKRDREAALKRIRRRLAEKASEAEATNEHGERDEA